jgi:hypothetical protein
MAIDLRLEVPDRPSKQWIAREIRQLRSELDALHTKAQSERHEPPRKHIAENIYGVRVEERADDPGFVWVRLPRNEDVLDRFLTPPPPPPPPPNRASGYRPVTTRFTRE